MLVFGAKDVIANPVSLGPVESIDLVSGLDVAAPLPGQVYVDVVEELALSSFFHY